MGHFYGHFYCCILIVDTIHTTNYKAAITSVVVVNNGFATVHYDYNKTFQWTQIPLLLFYSNKNVNVMKMRSNFAFSLHQFVETLWSPFFPRLSQNKKIHHEYSDIFRLINSASSGMRIKKKAKKKGKRFVNHIAYVFTSGMRLRREYFRTGKRIYSKIGMRSMMK